MPVHGEDLFVDVLTFAGLGAMILFIGVLVVYRAARRRRVGPRRQMSRPPNTRVRRTRSSASALRSPLTRRPLGGHR